MKNICTCISTFFVFMSLSTFLTAQTSDHMQHLFNGTASYQETQIRTHKSRSDLYRYRTIDGSYNSFYDFNRGKAHIPFERMTPAYYDGSGAGMIDRANPRMISNRLCTQTSSVPSAEGLSAFMLSWLQFVDHDITITKEGDEYQPIDVPMGDAYFDPFRSGDQVIPFTRVAYASGTGTPTHQVREQVNEITAWLDGSMVYGSDQARADWLRTFKSGKLKTSPSSLGDLPPCNTTSGDCLDDIDPNAPAMAGQEDRCGDLVKVFVLGDVRGNEQPGLTALHTLMIREHNRICDELLKKGKTDDEENYQYARKVVGGLIQSITYYEVLPALGVRLGEYKGWSRFDSPNIMNEFATAAYRLGHTMVTSNMYFQNEDCDIVGLLSGCGDGTSGVFGGASCAQDCNSSSIGGEVALRDAFFNPSLLANNPLEYILTGLAHQVQEEVDLQIVDDIRNFLFGRPGDGGLDLGAINIQRGRDHGLSDFNAIREKMNLGRYDRFKDITSDPDVSGALQEIYGDVDNIDAWIGFLAEDHMPNSSIGPSLESMLRFQFDKIRSADRFWFERDKLLEVNVRQSIMDTRLADVIMRNTTITDMRDVFYASGCDDVIPMAYCSSASTSSTKEWINIVQIGKHAFSSGNNGQGYNDLTDYSVIISAVAGETLSYRFKSKDKYGGRSKYWSAWIDFNQDGHFDDDERVVYQRGSSVYGKIKIVSSAKTGTTRLRVSMSGDHFTDPCEAFSRGEVEDYNIEIENGSQRTKSAEIITSTTLASLLVSPNPATHQDLIRISFESPSQGKGSITILDLSGRTVHDRTLHLVDGLNIYDLSTVDLRSGYYSVVFRTEGAQLVQPLIIAE